MTIRRNVPQSLLQELGLDKKIETISTQDKPKPASQFAEIARRGEESRPANIAPLPTGLVKSGREEDELIYAAEHPGQLQRLGFDFFTWTNDLYVGENVFTAPIILLEVPIGVHDLFVFLDWKNYALKEIGGDLLPMHPGEIDDSTCSIVLKRAGSSSASCGRYAYGPGTSVAGQPLYEENAVGSLDLDASFVWPGKFRYIIRGPDRLSVQVNFLAQPLPPFSQPMVIASKIIGFYRYG